MFYIKHKQREVYLTIDLADDGLTPKMVTTEWLESLATLFFDKPTAEEVLKRLRESHRMYNLYDVMGRNDPR